MGNDSPSRLSPNFHFNLQIEMPKRKLRSKMRMLNTLQLGPTSTLWAAKPIREEAEKYYSFSDFVASLNEMEEGVAPTDTRLRPDQREKEREH